MDKLKFYWWPIAVLKNWAGSVKICRGNVIISPDILTMLLCYNSDFNSRDKAYAYYLSTNRNVTDIINVKTVP